MAKRKMNCTGSVEHDIYVAEFKYEYLPKTFIVPKHEEVELIEIYEVGEQSRRISENEVPKEAVEWLLSKAMTKGRETLINQ